MAQRRMFSLQVIDTDKFMDMPASARLLYYELGMRADDDGFIASVKRITRTVGCNQSDIEVLLDKGYLLEFESGVMAIRHWKLNNQIRSDRYNPTIYVREYDMLVVENGVYEFDDVMESGFGNFRP